MVPPQTYRSVTDTWNGYHSVLVDAADSHLLTSLQSLVAIADRVAPQGFLVCGYTHCYDCVIADIPRKTKCVDDTLLWDESIEDHW